MKKLILFILLLPLLGKAQVLAPTGVTTKLSGGTSFTKSSNYYTSGFQYGWFNSLTGLWEQDVTARQLIKFYYPKTHLDSVVAGLIPITGYKLNSDSAASTGYVTRDRFNTVIPPATLARINGKEPTQSGTGYVKSAAGTKSYVTAIPNADLANSAITINGTPISLGGSVTTTGGTVTSFSKTDNYGIVSTVTNPTTTPNHAIAVDTTSAGGLASKARVAANYATLSGLALKAPLASPALTGTPTTPTPGSNINTTQIVNGYWVNNYYYPKTKTDTLYQPVLTLKGNSTIGNIPNSNSSLVWIGDSQSTVTGINAQQGAQYIVPRSIFNAADKGFPNNRSIMYQTVNNMANALSGNGITTTGSLSNAGGITQSQLTLTAGQTITITSKQVRYVDLLYNGSASSGTVTITVNGVTKRTITLSGTGIQNSYTGADIAGAMQTSMSDVIVLTASATVVIYGIETLHESHLSPAIYVAPRTATTYADFNNSTAEAEIAFYLNTLSNTSNPKYLSLALGSNSIYAPSKAETPVRMIAALDSLINGVKALATKVTPIIATPPRANETLWPVIKAGYTYRDYVNALVHYADSTGYALVRYDLTPLGTGASKYLNADGLHLSPDGQLVAANAWNNALGITTNSSLSENTINGADASNYYLANTNVGNSIPIRDINGNFSAGTITAALNGNATNFTGNLAGDVSGPQGSTVLSSSIPRRTSFNDGTQGLYIGAYTGGASSGALYRFGDTPGATNYKFIAGPTDTYINGTNGSHMAVGGSTIIDVDANRVSVNTVVNLKNYTVATLPTGTRGDIAYVTDALAPSFLVTVVGGGAVVTPVFYNGTNWVAQ